MSPVEAAYPYRDESGALVHECVRRSDKTFYFRRPDGRDGWVNDLRGVRRVLYRLPELRAAVAAGDVVFVVEGEKDVHTVESLGFTATTNPAGACKWRDEYSSHFRGAHVVVCPDNDDAGRKHAEKVTESLQGVAAEVTLLELPGLHEKGDITDWVANGGTREQLGLLIERARAAGAARTDGVLRDADRPRLALPLAEYLAGTRDEPDWLVEQLVARGTVTLLQAKPKVGKTTFALALVRAVMEGRRFLGLAVSQSPVLYLTEETDPVFGLALRRAGIEAGLPLEVLPRRAARELAWPDSGSWLLREVEASGAGVVVVDTFSVFAGLKDDDENKAGPVNLAIEPLRMLADGGFAVVVLAHGRKSGGSVVDSTRGSTALTASVDTILSLDEVGRTGDCLRRLEVVGRLGVPSTLTIELAGDGFRRVEGSATGARSEQAESNLLRALPVAEEDAVTVEELAGQMGIPSSTASARLRSLHRQNRVMKRRGAGHASTKADGYWAVRDAG